MHKGVLFAFWRSGNLSEYHSVSPDLGPNCLQRLSADDKKLLLVRKELRVNMSYFEKGEKEFCTACIYNSKLTIPTFRRA